MHPINSRIEALIERTDYSRLFETPEVFHDEWTFGDSVFCRIGLSTEIDGFGGVTGSASGPIDGDTADRAFFELLERAATITTMRSARTDFTLLDQNLQAVGSISSSKLFPVADSAEFRFAISNGVAAHWTLAQALPSARAELIERDQLLRAWYGHGTLDMFEHTIPSLENEYSIQAARFGEGVVGVFGLPRVASRPVIMGFGHGVEHAQREMLQRLTFLWDEEVPTNEPIFATNANYHQEYYLNAGVAAPVLQGWLSGQHSLLRESVEIAAAPSSSADVFFVDITPPELAANVSVVKAVSPSRLPLVFGRGNPAVKAKTSAKIESLVPIHPIA